MAKIPELQEMLENAEQMCDAVDGAAGRRHTTFGLLRVELCLFLAHLCKADFHLVDEEAACVAEALDIPFTTNELNTYIRTHHTESPDFAKNNPTSFARLVAYAAACIPEQGNAGALYIELFKAFGEALISADSVRTSCELSALADNPAALLSSRQ